MAGYKAANRFEGLDFEHIKLTLNKLAKFHAASAVYIEKEKFLDKKFDQGIYSDNFKPFMQQMNAKSAPATMECFAKWNSGDIVLRCEKQLNHLMNEGIFELVKRSEDRFNVLCHGDMWCNNVMFKYDEETGDVEDCILVDFQMCNINTPMLDLQYFIYSSLQQEIRMTKVDDIIAYYHKELVTNLTKLGYKKKIPTLFEMHRDFQAMGRYGMMTAFGTLTIALAPSSDDSDLLSFSEGNALQRMYLNPRYVEIMDELVPMFEKKGLLDW